MLKRGQRRRSLKYTFPVGVCSFHRGNERCGGGSWRPGEGRRKLHQRRAYPAAEPQRSPKKSELIQPPQARVSCPHPLPAVSLMIYLMRHLGGALPH